MKILKIIGIIIAIIIAGALIWVITLSGEAHLERTTTVDASVEKVYATINDFGQTKYWNPWMKIDPDAQYTYSDNTVGTGAYYSWTSDHPDVGNGRQDLIASTENQSVKTQMSFEGMTGTYTADFILEPDGEGTKLTWTFDGKADAMGEKVFISMTESILGPTYEEGLDNLKKYIEELPDPEPVIEEVKEEMVEGDSTVVAEEASEE